MEKLQCLLLIIGLLSYAYSKIVITELMVPQSIALNGSVDVIDLDCEYETVNETGIEVKWFFNGDYDQIYQWVPGYNNSRTAMGILKDRTDPNYKMTNDSDTEYRGFRITNIIRELTGNYTCKISGDYSEATKTKQMVIYSPVKSGMEIFLLNSDAIIICTANGIYPEPKVDLYIQQENGTKIDMKEDLDVGVDDDGYYNITVTRNLEEYNNSLTVPGKFVCNISIPGTDYFLVKELIHLGNDHEQALTNVTIEEELNQNITLTRYEIAAEIVGKTQGGSCGKLELSVVLLAFFGLILILIK